MIVLNSVLLSKDHIFHLIKNNYYLQSSSIDASFMGLWPNRASDLSKWIWVTLKHIVITKYESWVYEHAVRESNNVVEDQLEYGNRKSNQSFLNYCSSIKPDS